MNLINLVAFERGTRDCVEIKEIKIVSKGKEVSSIIRCIGLLGGVINNIKTTEMK